MPTRYQPLSVSSTEDAPSEEPGRINISASRYRTSPGPVSPWYCGCNCLEAPVKWLQERLQGKKFVGYAAGALFATGWWFFIDAVIFNKTHQPELPVEIKFEDWVPGLLGTMSLIMVNLIDKTALNATEFTHDGSHVAFKARLWAFLGVTIALGALGGALAIASLKYVVPGHSGVEAWGGWGIVAQNVLIFAGSMLFWFGRNSGEPELQLGF